MKEHPEDYPTFAKIHSRCRVVSLHSFISALFLYFSGPPLNEMKSYKDLFALVSVPFPATMFIVLEMDTFGTGDKCFWHRGKTLLALAGYLVLEMNALENMRSNKLTHS